MAKKKARKITKGQKRKIRFQQLIFITIAFIMIASVVVGLIR